MDEREFDSSFLARPSGQLEKKSPKGKQKTPCFAWMQAPMKSAGRTVAARGNPPNQSPKVFQGTAQAVDAAGDRKSRPAKQDRAFRTDAAELQPALTLLVAKSSAARSSIWKNTERAKQSESRTIRKGTFATVLRPSLLRRKINEQDLRIFVQAVEDDVAGIGSDVKGLHRGGTVQPRQTPRGHSAKVEPPEILPGQRASEHIN